MSDTEQRVVKAIAVQMGVDESTLVRETVLAEIGADSLDEVEICMAVEDEFGIEIPDDELERLTTVGAYFDYVTRAAK